VTYHSSIGLTSSCDSNSKGSPNLCFRSLACICTRIEFNGTKSVVWLPLYSVMWTDGRLFFSVRSQISTITMATFNTTVASFNVGYTDFFTEHIKKLCNPIPIPEMPCEPLACSNLPRSLTDSCINYTSLEDRDTIEGTNNFILKNGMLDLMVRSGALSRGVYCHWVTELRILYSIGKMFVIIIF